VNRLKEIFRLTGGKWAEDKGDTGESRHTNGQKRIKRVSTKFQKEKRGGSSEKRCRGERKHLPGRRERKIQSGTLDRIERNPKKKGREKRAGVAVGVRDWGTMIPKKKKKAFKQQGAHRRKWGYPIGCE